MKHANRQFSRMWWFGRHHPDVLTDAEKKEAWRNQTLILTAEQLKESEKALRTLRGQLKLLPEGTERRSVLVSIQALTHSLSTQEANAVRQIHMLTKLIEVQKKAGAPAGALIKRRWEYEKLLAPYQEPPPVLVPPLLTAPPALKATTKRK